MERSMEHGLVLESVAELALTLATHPNYSHWRDQRNSQEARNAIIHYGASVERALVAAGLTWERVDFIRAIEELADRIIEDDYVTDASITELLWRLNR